MARILIVAGDGTVSDHLDYAYFRMLEEGFDVTIAAPEKRMLKTAIHMGWIGDPIYTIERQGYNTPAHATLSEVDPTQYDGLLLPGGRAPEYLSNLPRAREVVRHFVDANKPIAAICHGPLLLLAAGVTGRTLSCTDDTGVDVELAGNTYVETKGAVEGQPGFNVDGNIVTVRRRPYNHAWVSQFLVLLEKRGIKRPHKFNLKSANVLIVAGDFTSAGQLTYGIDRMREEGLEVTIAGHVKKRLDTVVDNREQGWNVHEPVAAYNFESLGYWIAATAAIDEVDPAKFDGLLLPGWRGTEYLRNMKGVRGAVRHFMETGKPIGGICQAARLLTAAGVKGKRLTGSEIVKIDIARANTYVDAGGEAVIDGNIATVSGRPYYHVWTRSFLTLLQQHQQKSR